MDADDITDPTPTPAPVRVWTLSKGARVATCDAQAHVLGVELVSEVDGDVRRTEVARTADAGQAVAETWRQAFIAKGWHARTP